MRVRAMREHQRRVWAVSVIQKYYAGWAVRRQYRSKFRAIAGPKIARFMLTSSVSYCDIYYSVCSLDLEALRSDLSFDRVMFTSSLHFKFIIIHQTLLIY